MANSEAWSTASGIAAAQHGAFTRRQALAHGLSARSVRRLLDSGILREPVPGVLVFAAAAGSVRQQLWIATHSAGGGFLAAGAAAAWLYGLDGFGADPPLEVIGARGRRAPPIQGLVLRTGVLAPVDCHEVDGIPCLSLARTICEVAGSVGAEAARRAIDDFERRRFSLRWLAETAERLHRPGQSGTRIVLELLARRSGRAPDSWFERLVEACVALPGLPPWTRQHAVVEDGRLLGRVDLACVPLRLAVEAHSKRFHFGPDREAGDQRRDDNLSAAGWDVRYVGWHAATDAPQEVAQMIERVARRRAADLGLALPWAS